MQYWRSIITGVIVITCVVVYSIFIFVWSKDNCPLGTFPCTDKGICVPQRSVCNNHNDCPNGEDEDPVLCIDLNGSVNMVYQTINKSNNANGNHNKTQFVCDIPKYPENCSCRSRLRLICRDSDLNEIPQNISSNVTHLVLPNNSIHTLDINSFAKYANLRLIHLEGNQLLHLPPKIFLKQGSLLRLFLTHNNLTAIRCGVFDGLHELLWLFLRNNNIEIIEMEAFRDLQSLEWMDLSNNKLTLEKKSFPPLQNLLELFLDYNNIASITNDTFSQLVNLELLKLHKNKISVIEQDAFKNLKNLRELNLDGNQLPQLDSRLFNYFPLLTKLYIGNNPIRIIPSMLFNKLNNLSSLNLDEIEIENIDLDIFSRLRKLESIYFKKYHYCAFAPTVRRCRPLSDGVSSSEHLLDKPILRYATWCTCFITCVGNILVIWGRLTIRDENKVLSMVVRNLAASDFLMGIYLLIIAYHDIKYRGIYHREAHYWMSSWDCTISGILAMISSEVSILLLVFMSVERFLLIAVPFGHFTAITFKPALILLISIWILGIGLAVIPAIEFQSSTRFYGLNGLCFPLHINEPFFLGWKYSAAIMLGINASSLLIIAIVYCVMFISIWKTRHATSLPIKDFEFAIRFFFIVLTDASCWFPIILVKIFAFTGMEISADIYAWLVVFVLPINSAVNPLLYTFTTPRYRSKMYNLKVPLKCIGENKNAIAVPKFRRPSPQSNLDTGSTPSASGSRSGQNPNTISTTTKKF